MGISLPMLADMTGKLDPKRTVHGTSTLEFTSVGMFNASQRPLSNRVYICMRSELMAVPSDLHPQCCIALDDTKGSAETGDFGGAVIVMRDVITAVELFEQTTALLSRVDAWTIELQRIVLDGGTVQDLIDASAHMLLNHIAVTDASFKLLYSSKGNIPDDDPITSALTERGYHPEQTLRAFRHARRFAEWDHSRNDLIVNTSRELTPYDTVSRLFRFKQIPFIYVVMTCNIEPPSKGVLDRLRILLDSIGRIVEREWSSGDTLVRPFESLLDDLIEGRIDDAEAVAGRAHALGVSSSTRWLLCSLVEADPTSYSMGRLANQISDAADADIVSYRTGEFVVLKAASESHRDEPKKLREALSALAERYGMRCAISACYSGLENTRTAYLQAQQLLKGPLQKNAAPFVLPGCSQNAGSPAATFDANLWPCMLAHEANRFELYNTSTYGDALDRVERMGTRAKPDNLTLLATYLACERNAAKTGELLFTHRNNVLYRMKRIQDALELDLENLHTRQCLMMLCTLRLARGGGEAAGNAQA